MPTSHTLQTESAHRQTHADLDRTRTNRAAKFAALEWVRGNVTRKGAKSCLHFAGQGFGVNVAATATGATHLSGVKRCASPWSCPVCAPTIANRRAEEIDAAIVAHLDSGGRVYFVTGTLRHHLGDDLDQLLTMLQRSWSRTWRWAAPYYSKRTGELTNGDRIRPGWYGGQVRTVEVTSGRNGWHPHVHSLVFVPADCTDSDAIVRAGLRAAGRRWGESVERNGGSTDVRTSSSPGWDVRAVTSSTDIAAYLTKVEAGWSGWSAGRELAKADQKTKGVTPWMLLEQAVAGDPRAAKLFKVYERATRGLRRIVASPGLLDMVEDDEAAVEQLDDDPVVIVTVPPGEWRRLLAARQAARLLSDVADLAAGRSSGWAWPPGWLTASP